MGGDLREGLGLRAVGREWKDDLDVVVIACGRVGKRERERKEEREERGDAFPLLSPFHSAVAFLLFFFR